MTIRHPEMAAFLAARRHELGLSVEGLAGRVGVTKSTYYSWEIGHALPKTANFEALARGLDVAYEDLFAVAGYALPGGLPAFSPYLRARYGSLPEEALAEAEQYFADLQARHEAGGGDADEPDR